MYNYKKLQNGSDIRGVALSGEAGKVPNLKKLEATRIGQGFLLWLCKKTGEKPENIKIAIGRDPRLSGKHLREGLVTGLGPYGVRIYDCGLASTPAMFMATMFEEYNCHGAIMITASHLPYTRNGFKFFTKTGGVNKEDVSEIIEYAEQDKRIKELGALTCEAKYEMVLGKVTYPTESIDLMGRYARHLRKKIKEGVNDPKNYDRPLQGLHIVVDAGNGAGGFFATEVLHPLGADIRGSQFLTPDGTFPNHPPNPEDKEAMAAISTRVISQGADLGLIFDTDVDRSSAVDSRGREISRNNIVALAAALVAEENPGTTVVTDSVTSSQVTTFIEEELGLKHLRFQRGYRNVINKAIQLNQSGTDSQLAIETSGHAALKENYFLDDGAYLATKIVVKTALLAREGKTIDQLIEKLKGPEEAAEFRVKITNDDFGSYADEIFKQITLWVQGADCGQAEGCDKCKCGMSIEEPNYEGVRINFDKENGEGWCLIRKSLHDPIMPINIESNVRGGVNIIIEKLMPFMEQYQEIDLTPLNR